MDVLSVESCVQAVLAAYRDATRLVQRLKDKQKTSEEFILPEDLTQDFEASLSLGCTAVQSQYDHDVRRFGETYARGDALAREQMKDILINLQHAVVTHLREVFMDDATLDLHGLKETSDDSRVDAVVCLGQLYQRMSTATAAMKQLSRSQVDESDPSQLPSPLAYSSSRSTHSSVGAYDNQSATSYSTYSSRTATGHDRKPSGGAPRTVSVNSGYSNFSYKNLARCRTPGEHDVPALPLLPLARPASQDTVGSAVPIVPNTSMQSRAPRPCSVAPPPYPYKQPPFAYTTDDKGQIFPKESSFYQPPGTDRVQTPRKGSSPPVSPRSTEFYSPASEQTRMLESRDESPSPSPQSQSHSQDGYESTPTSPLNQRPAVPLNPDYSTLEHVATVSPVDAPSRSPIALASAHEYDQNHQYLQQVQQQMPRVGPYVHLLQADNDYATMPTLSQSLPTRPISRPRTIGGTRESMQVYFDPLPHHRALRPLSIRSSGSTGSKTASYATRRGLPPGLADAIQKPALLPEDSRPRYIRPKTLDLSNGHGSLIHGPKSPIAQHVDNMSDDITIPSSPGDEPSLEATMKAQAPPAVQVARSELNLPSEANLFGFCKGAVRQQLGSRKKGFSVESRRGPRGQEVIARCTKCRFEGAATISTALPSGARGAPKREKAFDNRVRVSGGIKYRWAFLAKSHVFNDCPGKDAVAPHHHSDMFGCYFCCAEGAAKGWMDDNLQPTQESLTRLARLGTFGKKSSAPQSPSTSMPTLTFKGVAAFMAHLQSHRLPSRMPGLVVANEMNCIIGRIASDNEDFDLNLSPLAG